MHIRPANLEELAAVAALVNMAYRGEAASRSWTTEAAFIEGQRTTEAMLRSELEERRERCILVLHETAGGPLLGCVMLDLIDGAVCYLGMLSVSPDAQNQGIGKRLIAASQDWARGRGADRLRITVIQVRRALIEWYERHGFVRTGETEPFPYDDKRFGTPLRDDLHFVVLERPL